MHRPWGRTLAGRFLGICLPAAAVLLAGLADPGSLPPSVGKDLLAPAFAGVDLQSPSAAPSAPSPSLRKVERRLRRGETLAEVLRGLGLTGPAAHRLLAAVGRHVELRQLRDGTLCVASIGADGGLAAIALELDGRGILSATAEGGEWQATWRAFTRSVETRSVQGELTGAFEAAVAKAGAPPDLAYAAAEVLQWDLDFNRDLRRGDRFEILFEEVLLEGKRFALGHVLAVRYVNRGRTLEAYRFGDGEYFDGEGRPLQKMFLRSPIPYSRVTSRFSNRRFHPVLKVARPHYGVDYGAPVGTPARVTAAGVVTHVGWDGGGGKTVKVRHPNGFLTGYLHLSRFAAGLKAGDRVAQGEVIGYVGSTGLSTGPHLDYRVQQNGRWIDPLSLNRVPADPVPTAKLAEFRATRDRMRESLAGPTARPPGAPAPAEQLAAR